LVTSVGFANALESLSAGVDEGRKGSTLSETKTIIEAFATKRRKRISEDQSASI